MPLMFQPSPPEVGPGSAVGRQRRRKQRRRARTLSPTRPHGPSESSIGRELLEWDDYENERNPNSINKIGLPEEAKKKRDISSLDARKAEKERLSSHMTNPGCNLPSMSNITVTQSRALGIDTRFLAHGNDAFGKDLCRHYQGFLQTLNRRGVAPSLVATTVASHKGAATLQLFDQIKADALIPLSISVAQDSAVVVPKELSAKVTWNLLQNMVGVIVREAEKKSGTTVSGLGVTLLSSDVAFFCDVNLDSHKKAANSFIDYILPLFDDSKVADIHIVVAKTGRITLEIDHDSVEEGMIDDHGSSSHSHYGAALARCIHMIQIVLSARAQEEFEKNRMMFRNPLSVTLTIIDHSPIGYKYLSRLWVRSSFVGQRTRIRVDLPTLIDGTQCTMALEIRYQTLPYAVGSPEMASLAKDLRLLAACRVRVVRAIPFSSIDASLLYGIPMQVQAALEVDFRQSQEMEVLVRSLMKYLYKNNLALLLIAVPEEETLENMHLPCLRTDKLQGYVLMAQEFPQSAQQLPQSGLLFRYARADDMLQEASPVPAALFADDATIRQYEDYIDCAMDMIQMQPDNPLDAISLIEDSFNCKVATSADSDDVEFMEESVVVEPNDNKWNDDCVDDLVAALDESEDDIVVFDE